jgi:hypothetical protein
LIEELFLTIDDFDEEIIINKSYDYNIIMNILVIYLNLNKYD